MNIVKQRKVISSIMTQHIRPMSFWKKFIPKFARQDQKSKSVPDKDEGQMISSSQEEIRMKILQAEIEENQEVGFDIHCYSNTYRKNLISFLKKRRRRRKHYYKPRLNLKNSSSLRRKKRRTHIPFLRYYRLMKSSKMALLHSHYY